MVLQCSKQIASNKRITSTPNTEPQYEQATTTEKRNRLNSKFQRLSERKSSEIHNLTDDCSYMW